MALKLIIIFVLLYFVARAVGNMVQAVLKDPKAPAPPPVEPRPPRSDRTPSWQGPSPHQSHRTGPDVEDAKWVDLD